MDDLGLERPSTASARVLGKESPTLPTEGMIPASAKRSADRSGTRDPRDRDYWVYAPRRSRARRLLGRPALLLLLHGCDQSAEALIRSTRFVEQAAARDYIVVFPHVTSRSPVPWRARNCWGFWIEAERHRDEGELGQISDAFSIRSNANSAPIPGGATDAGLSSGGAMAVAMAVAYPDVVRAAGAVAGLAYGGTSAAVSNPRPFRSVAPWFSAVAAGHPGPKMRSLPGLVQDMEVEGNTSGDDRSVPLLVIQSTHDEVVQIENARCCATSGLPAMAGSKTVPSNANGFLTRRASGAATSIRKGECWSRRSFTRGDATLRAHYRPGDGDDPPYAHITGPSATDALLDFFELEGL